MYVDGHGLGTIARTLNDDPWWDEGAVKQAEYDLIDAPHLRIVPPELWDAAQARYAASAKTYLWDTKGHLLGDTQVWAANRSPS